MAEGVESVWGEVTRVSPASPQDCGPLGSQHLFSPLKSSTGVSWAHCQSGHPPARNALKVSGVQLYVPGKWEAET